MSEVVYVVDGESRGLLASLVGKKLEYVEGYHLDILDDESKVTFDSAVRMYFSDGNTYDLSIEVVRVDIAEGQWDDTGAFALSEAKGEIWTPEGVSPASISVNGVVDEVIIVNDHDELMHGSLVAGIFDFTKAIVLHVEKGFVAFSMDDFDDEAIAMRCGPNKENLVPDGSGSWYDEPGWTDNYSREYLKLA